MKKKGMMSRGDNWIFQLPQSQTNAFFCSDLFCSFKSCVCFEGCLSSAFSVSLLALCLVYCWATQLFVFVLGFLSVSLSAIAFHPLYFLLQPKYVREEKKNKYLLTATSSHDLWGVRAFFKCLPETNRQKERDGIGKKTQNKMREVERFDLSLSLDGRKLLSRNESPSNHTTKTTTKSLTKGIDIKGGGRDGKTRRK